MVTILYFFFFKQKTAYEIKECDWSSDVCSSNLASVERHIDPGTHHGDVHLGARNEAKISVGRARRAPGEMELRHDLVTRERGGRLGKWDSVMIPARASEVRPGLVTMLSTGASRWPFGPTMTHVALAAIRAGTLSAAGEALQRLPARGARPCTWVEPIRFAASTTPGHARPSASCSPITAPDVAAPMMNPPSTSRIPISPGIFLVSTMRSGFSRPDRSCTTRSVPPANSFATPPAPAR